MSLCWMSLCWVSFCWMSLCWVPICWVGCHLNSVKYFIVTETSLLQQNDNFKLLLKMYLWILSLTFTHTHTHTHAYIYIYKLECYITPNWKGLQGDTHSSLFIPLIIYEENEGQDDLQSIENNLTFSNRMPKSY